MARRRKRWTVLTKRFSKPHYSIEALIPLPVHKKLGRFSVRHVYPGQGHRLVLVFGRWCNLSAFVEHDTVIVPIQDTVLAQCNRMIPLENPLHSTDRSEDTAVAALEVHHGPKTRTLHVLAIRPEQRLILDTSTRIRRARGGHAPAGRKTEEGEASLSSSLALRSLLGPLAPSESSSLSKSTRGCSD